MSLVRTAVKVVLVVVVGVTVGTLLGHPSVVRLFGGKQPLKWADPPPPSSPVSIAGAPAEGGSEAPVVVIEYTDFECPSCRHFAKDVLPALRDKYINTGVMRFVVKNFPIESLHPMAVEAAAFAECTRDTGEFWTVHDRLMTYSLEHGSLERLVTQLGLDGPSVRHCAAEDGQARVRRQRDEARAIGITATPTFFVGRWRGADLVDVGVRFSGSQSPEYFDQVVRLVTH
jgi:hypothetical protein